MADSAAKAQFVGRTDRDSECSRRWLHTAKRQERQLWRSRLLVGCSHRAGDHHRVALPVSETRVRSAGSTRGLVPKRRRPIYRRRPISRLRRGISGSHGGTDLSHRELPARGRARGRTRAYLGGSGAGMDQPIRFIVSEPLKLSTAVVYAVTSLCILRAKCDG